MAISKTTYLELNKPDYDAIADIEVLNANSDIIDEQFDGTHLVASVNGVTPVDGAVDIDLGVTSVNGQTGDVTITERSIKQLIDIIYPVGTYYETTDANFNPNNVWTGTTWQKITDGRVLIAGGGDYSVGGNYGEKTHKITTAEMPVHSHAASAASNGGHAHNASTTSAGAHTHSRGSMNITGTYATKDLTNDSNAPSTTGAFGSFRASFREAANGNSNTGYGISFDASKAWTGVTSSAGAHTHTVTVASNGAHGHTITVGNSGSGTAMSLVQPSKAVARWLRTA